MLRLEKNDPWYRSPRLLVELFALVNLAGLVPDIYLAHRTNNFAHWAEYVPLVFSLVAVPLFAVAILCGERWSRPVIGSCLGLAVGWLAVLIGIAGLILHLDSRFFQERTLASLVYAAPFAAPLAYTGIGLLIILNRMVRPDSAEWGYWVLLLALGGFVGNFIFSVTDHAQNGFYHWSEAIPVFASAFAIGFLTAPFLAKIRRPYFKLCGFVMLVQVAVGLLGFFLHFRADLRGVAPTLFDNLIYGAPVLAPMLFPNLAILASLALWTMAQRSG